MNAENNASNHIRYRNHARPQKQRAGFLRLQRCNLPAHALNGPGLSPLPQAGFMTEIRFLCLYVRQVTRGLYRIWR